MPTPRPQPVAFDRALVAGFTDEERRDLAAGLLARAEHVRAHGFGRIADALEADALAIDPLLIQ